MLRIYQNKTSKIGFLKNRSLIFLLFILSFVFSLQLTAQNYIVNSNIDAVAANLVTGETATPGQITLRSAVQAATAQPGAHIITFSGGVVSPINLSLGQITIGNAANGNNITITGPGMNLLTVNQTTENRIFSTGTGAVTILLQDITLNYTGPAVTPYSGGGGAIIAGGAGAASTFINCRFTNFQRQIGNGGAISQSSSLTSHNLTITNCIFINNRCGGAGGAVSFNSQGGTATITGCTFDNNHTGVVGANTGGDGGAVSTTGGGSGGTYLIERNTFLNNQVENVTGHAGAVMNTNGTLTLRFNRFIGNTCANVAFPPLANIVGQAGGATIHVTIADNNWWGVNTGPGTNDATALAAGAVMTVTKWLQLKTTASPNPICNTPAGLGNTTTVTTSFLSNSASEAIAVGNLPVLIGLPVTWGPTTLGSLSGQQGTIQAAGTATALFTSNGTGGTATINTQVDNIPAGETSPARANITVNTLPIVTNPANFTSCVGGTATFTSTITGTPVPAIQWRIGGVALVNGVQGSGSTVSGATTATLTITNVQSGDASANYNVQASNQCGLATSANATLTVNSVTGGTVAADQTICSGGDPAAFTETVASTGSGALTYQWQSSTTSCAAGFANIGGATGVTYDAPSGVPVTTYYRRVTISTLNAVPCTANSNCITITVNSVTGGTVGTDHAICTGGDPAAFTQTLASTGSGALTYQWQSSITSCGAGFTDIGGATAITYDAPSGVAVTTYYRRVTTSILSGVPCTANSNCITVTVNSVTGGTVATDQSVCSGGDPALFTETVASTGSGALTYQWQISTTDCVSGFSNIGGANSATYNAPAGLLVTTYYRRVTTSTLNAVPCTANSNCITVSINNVTGGTIAANQTICTGGDPAAFTESVASTGSGVLTYQWQSSITSCAAGFGNIGGANSATYDAPAGIAVTTYYRRVTTSTLNAVPCTANSNCITITVNCAPVMSSSLRDALLVDVNGNSIANPNDQLRYTTIIRNTGTQDGTGANLNLAAPINTTENPNSRSTSALARDDAFTTPFQTLLNVGNLTTNDFGLNAGVPAVTVVSFGTTASLGTTTLAGSVGTTDAGGTLTVNANGTFSYQPPVGFSGPDQFMYIATTGVAGLPNNDAVVRITVQPPAPPVAVNDPNGGLPANSTPPSGTNPNPYHTEFNTVLTVPDGTNDLLANDNLSSPAAVIVSYGVLGTEQTVLGSATPTSLGGTVAVFADGHFIYTPPAGFTGLDNFKYIIQNVSGPSTGTVTVAVGFRPNAVAESYNVTGNVQIIPNAAQGVLANDGGTSVVVTAVNSVAANVGNMFTTVNGSNITVNADGSFTYNPGPGYDGPTETFTYTINNGFASPSIATVTLNISGMVWFIDAAAGAGNGRLSTPFNSIAAFQTLNDGVGNHPAANDNIFVYENAAAYTGSFTLLNGQKLIGQDATASLGTITGLTPNVTYSAQFPVMNTSAPATTLTTTVAATNSVNLNSAAGTNLLRGFTIGNTTSSGISGSNFGTLTILDVSKNGTGQALALTNGAFAAGSTIDNITTTNSVNAVSLTTITGNLIVTTGAISGATGTAFNISGGTVSVTYSGGITQTANAAMVSVSGGHATGTVTFNTGALSATNGTGFQFDNADGTYNFNGTSTLNGGDAGIDLSNGCGGTFSFPAGISITNPTNEVIRIASSTATFTYGGGFTKNNNNISGITITGNTGGTIAINGSGTKTLSTGTGNAVNLTTNTGTTINFSNNNLLLTTTSGIGFNATGGGTISVTGTGNTITSTTGVALNVANTTIGASNLNFQSISANGASNGMILNTTGSSGGLVVTGTGSAGTGGTIQNSVTDGVVITSSLSPTLSFMNINDNAGGATDDGMVLTNITGTVTFTGLSISGSPHNGITFDNFNTNLTAFVMTNCTIACPSGFPCQPSGSTGNDGILLVMRGTSILTSGLISGCTFSGVRAVAVQIQTNDVARIGSASGGLITAPVLSNSFTVQNNTFTGNGQGIDMATSQVSSMAFQILNNTIVGKLTIPNAIANTASSHAINAFTAAGADTGPGSHFFIGKIDGNTIGTLGVKDSGSGFGSGIRAVVQGQTTQGNITISNNIIRETPNSALISVFGQNGAAVTGSNTAHFKIVNNTMPAPSGSNLSLCGPANTACADVGIFILADEGTPVCNVITGNTIYDVTTMNGSFDIYLAERIGPPAGAQLTVEGTGGSNSAYILANNTLAGPNKFVDEGANTSQVALNSCGAFPSIVAPPDNPTGKADNNLKIEQQKTKLNAVKNVIPIKKKGEKWVGKTPENVNK